jgi:hypothetical protein
MLCITKAIRVENQIAAIEKQKEIRDLLEGLAREQPASLSITHEKVRCKFKIRKWVQVKKNLLLCRSHCSCAECITEIGKTSGKSTMSKVLSKCFLSHYKVHYYASLKYPKSSSSFSKSSNSSSSIVKNSTIPLVAREQQPILASLG